MAREHTPIQIGLPEEPAWQVAEPTPFALVAFLAGDEMPDPGESFLAAGRAFGGEPRDVEPLPIEDERVAWGFAFTAGRRASRVLVWCERADPAQLPSAEAADARWVLSLETILDDERPVEDFAALCVTLAASAGPRLRLLYDAGLGATWNASAAAELLATRGELVDERQLYRIEVVARDRAKGPFWLSTVGMSRLLKPELEMLEVPPELLRTALELVDATAARLVTAEFPHAGVPFEVGPDLKATLVPAREAAETVDPECAGGERDRRHLPPGPRAAICAPGQRGSFRKVWVPPLDELAALAQGEAALYIAERVVDVRARLARRTWPTVLQALAARTTPDAYLVSAKVLLSKADAADAAAPSARGYAWLDLDSADAAGGTGALAHDLASLGRRAGERISFELESVADWRLHGMRPDAAEIGPETPLR